MRSDRAREAAAVAAVTVVAGVLRFRSLAFGFPQLTRPDEEAIVTVAARVLGGDFNPGFFDYPTLFMYIVALVEKLWLGGPADPNDLRPYLIARTLSAMLGTLSVPLLYWLVRKLYSPRTALIAAALFAVAFLHVRDSHFGVTDVPATFMTLVAFAAIVFLVVERPRWWSVLLAAIACGLAASTKYNAGVVVMSLVTAIVTSEQRRNFRLYAIAVAGSIVGFLSATPYAWLARDKFLADFSVLSGRLVADRTMNAGIGYVHHFTFSLWYGLGPLFLFAVIAGFVLASFDSNRRRAMLTMSFPLLYYLVIGRGHLVYMRYMTPFVPFAAILAAIAIDAVAKRAGGTIMAIALTLIAGVDSAARAAAMDQLLAQTDSRVLAADYVRGRFPTGVSMLQTGSPYGQVRLWPEGIYPTDVPLDKQPQLILIQTSPLVVFSAVPPTLRSAIAGSYRLVHRVDVGNRDVPRAAVFDQEDAWYVPVSGFARYERPGPAIEIFEKVPD